MSKNMDKKKKTMIIVGILLLLGIIVGVSFAWWTGYAVQDSINKIKSDCLKLTISDVNNSAINLEKAYPITDGEAEELIPYTFTITNTCSNNAEYEVHLEIMDLGEENQIASQYLSMNFNGEGKKNLATGYTSVDPTYQKSDYTANDAKYLTSGTLNAQESVTYNLKIWIDESVTAKDPVMNREWIGKVSVTSSLTQFASTNFSEFIMNKEGVERIEHEATEQTPALTDYRYVGANPNNYVYFGCSDNCTEDNLYRVIGVIPTQSSASGSYKNRVKLIKASNWEGETAENESSYTASGKGYRWNTSNINKWEDSSLKNTLNAEYWNSLGEYQSYIEKAKWYLGAPSIKNHNTYTIEQFYTLERSNTPGKSGGVISYINNIGLMYPSDYGYSIDGGVNGEVWLNQAHYDNRDYYKSSAWLYQLEEKYVEWTTTPEATYSNPDGLRVWAVNSSGELGATYVSNDGYYFGVRPVFYLKEDVMVISGNGTESDPYKISRDVSEFNKYIIAEASKDSSIVEINHEATSQTPSLTDYRYVGANPNNYVCFGYEGARCPDNNLYRIIGVIPTQSTNDGEYENRVKLIKNDYYTENESGNLETGANAPGGKGYRWNKDNGSNDWSQTTLNTEVLNRVYWNSLLEYQSYIEKAKWYLGAPQLADTKTYTPNQFYKVERSNTQGYSKGATSFVGNIGLMYPSDYGYSMEMGYWDHSIFEDAQYFAQGAWLYRLEDSKHEWILSPETNTFNNESAYAWNIYGGGYKDNPGGSLDRNRVYDSNHVWGIRPTFYLNTSVQYKSGTGSIDDPYRIGL